MRQLYPRTASNFKTNALLTLARARVRLAALLASDSSFHVRDELAVSAMGLNFANPVGVAAGFDRNGTLINPLARLGFGSVEVGTVTPQPELGHNPGVAVLVDRLTRISATTVVGVSIGANSGTASDQVATDYVCCMRQAWGRAGYIALNLNSPRLNASRGHISRDFLQDLLEKVRAEHSRLTSETGRSVPIVVKIPFEISMKKIPDALHMIKALSFDGVIAAVRSQDNANFAVERVIADLAEYLEGSMPIISVGGVRTAADVLSRQAAGAALVQVFSGLLHYGETRFIRHIEPS